MDGCNYTSFSLELPGVGALTVGGGEVVENKRLYLVIFYDLKGDFSTLTDPDGDPDELIWMVVERSDGHFQEDELVDFPTMVAAYQYFYKTGKLSPDLPWE